VTHFLYEQTGRSPIVIPVVNVIGGSGNRPSGNNGGQNGQDAQAQKPQPTPEQQAAEAQKRFAEMRNRLLNQDPRTD
jgi:hypothetical protein